MSIEAPANPSVAPKNWAQPQPCSAGREDPAAETEFSFDDFLDIINPLQHIPVISLLYREITGDQIHGASRIVGGMLYGGPLGLIGGIIDAVAEQATGHDIADNVVAALFGEPDGAPAAASTLADAGAAAAVPDRAPASAASGTAAGTPSGTAAVVNGPAVSGGRPAAGAAAPAATAPAAAAESTEEAQAVLATAVLPHGMPVPQRGAVPVRSLAQQPSGPSRPVTINSRLDAALMAMAASGRAPATTPSAPAQDADRTADPAADRTSPGSPSLVPRNQVPAAMQRALDQYRRSARTAEVLPPS